MVAAAGWLTGWPTKPNFQNVVLATTIPPVPFLIVLLGKPSILLPVEEGDLRCYHTTRRAAGLCEVFFLRSTCALRRVPLRTAQQTSIPYFFSGG